jgi:hypothetical protein
VVGFIYFIDFKIPALMVQSRVFLDIIFVDQQRFDTIAPDLAIYRLIAKGKILNDVPARECNLDEYQTN